MVMQDPRVPKHLKVLKSNMRTRMMRDGLEQELQEKKGYCHVTHVMQKDVQDLMNVPKFCPECGAWIRDTIEDAHKVGYQKGWKKGREDLVWELIVWIGLVFLAITCSYLVFACAPCLAPLAGGFP
jgi:hypothetical protein